MAYDIVNLTKSIVNVPFPSEDPAPRYTLLPGQTITLTDEQLAQVVVNPDVKTRFLAVTSGVSPLLSVRPTSSRPVPEPEPLDDRDAGAERVLIQDKAAKRAYRTKTK